jgi:hypothetical protein
VVDQASVAAELLKGLPPGLQQRRDARGRVFKMPGQGMFGNELGDCDKVTVLARLGF